MSRLARCLALAAALTAVAAAPASAQTPAPPCTPSTPIPNAVDCAFDTIVWATQSPQPVPSTVSQAVQHAIAEAIELATAECPPVRRSCATVDTLEQELFEQLCFQTGNPPTLCGSGQLDRARADDA